MRRFAAALSEHPVPAHATGEVVGALLEQVGEAPDLAVLFVTAPLVGALDDMVAAVHATLRPAALVGCTAVSVVGGAREVEEQSAVALWAGRCGPVRTQHLDAASGPDGPVWSPLQPEPGGAAVVLADPFSFPIDAFVAAVGREHPDVTLIGGLASAARAPGANRLVAGSTLHRSGAVVVHLPAGVLAGTVVSQGCRPIGDPWVVTASERNVVLELAGRPALDRLLESLERLDPAERALAARGLHVGVVIDERRAEFGRGDFLVRNVLGADRERRAVAFGDVVEVGTTVQFQVRDAESADEDLRALLADRSASGALLFTCNGRGTHLFGVDDHDAALVDEVAGGATAGMFCAGEIGPVGGRPFLHGFTASVALFA